MKINQILNQKNREVFKREAFSVVFFILVFAAYGVIMGLGVSG